nr:glycosyltransferase family 2 protein [uncultured Tenacibaculum sp.]
MIIPTFNNLKKLKQCLLSIQAQSYTNFEVWIIDGASTDGTIEFLKTLPSRFHFISEKDKGIYDAMNKGINLANGEWLYFMGADDRFYNNYVLDTLSAYFEKKVKLIFGKIKYKVKDYYPFIYNQKKIYKHPSWDWKIWIRNAVHHQGTLFNKELFYDRQYNLKYKILSDYHLNIALYKSKESYTITDLCIAECLSSGVSKTGNWSIYKEEALLKSDSSSYIFYPFFYLLVFIKYCLTWSTKKKP